MISDAKMTLLYDDDSIVVVEKISGFLSVPGRGEHNLDSVSWRVKNMFDGCIEQPSVHRLDMDTSGLLVLALSKDAHRHLSIQFQNRETDKVYEALLEGHIKKSSGTIELPFRLDVDNRPYQIFDPEHGKMGITKWRKIAEEGDFTRIEFKPVTGRTHQLRVHSAHSLGLGVPIVGDPLYGSGNEAGKLKLHARYLAFTHPVSGERMSFESKVPF